MDIAGLGLVCVVCSCYGRRVHLDTFEKTRKYLPSKVVLSGHVVSQHASCTTSMRQLQNQGCFGLRKSMEELSVLLLGFINVAVGLQVTRKHCKFVVNTHGTGAWQPLMFKAVAPQVKMLAPAPDYDMDGLRGEADWDAWAAEIEERERRFKLKNKKKDKVVQQPKLTEKKAEQREEAATPAPSPRKAAKQADWDSVLRGLEGSARLVARRAAELALRAAVDWDTKFTKFLDPLEVQYATLAVSRLEKRHGLGILPVGGYPAAERQRLAVGRTDVLEALGRQYLEEEAVALVTVSGDELQRAKAGSLSQRDFLGAILGAGFDRSFIGDVLLLNGADIASLASKNEDVAGEAEGNPPEQEEGEGIQNEQMLLSVETSNLDPEALVAGQFLVDPDIVQPLLESFDGVGNVRKVEVARMPLGSLRVPEARTQEKRAVIASLRLDAVVAGAFQVSRGEATELIKKGKVKVNFLPSSKATVQVANGDMLSCRGKGRVKMDVIGETQKGRLRVNFLRFV